MEMVPIILFCLFTITGWICGFITIRRAFSTEKCFAESQLLMMSALLLALVSISVPIKAVLFPAIAHVMPFYSQTVNNVAAYVASALLIIIWMVHPLGIGAAYVYKKEALST